MLVVSISPELNANNHGHFQPFEETLAKTLKSSQVKVIHAVGAAHEASSATIPWFSNTRHVLDLNLSSFKVELGKLVEFIRQRHSHEDLVFFIYTGDKARLEAVQKVAEDHPGQLFVISLIWDGASLLDSNLYPKATNVRIGVESEDLVSAARLKGAGNAVFHLPTLPPQPAEKKPPVSSEARNRVTFFTSEDPARGPEITKRTIPLVKESLSPALRLTLRLGHAPGHPPIAFGNHRDVERLDQDLPKRSWERLLRETQIGVVPYVPSAWKYKPSGIFVELITRGCLPVALSNTWMSEELRRLGLHALVAKPSPVELSRTILSSIRNRADILRHFNAESNEISRRYSKDRFSAEFRTLGKSFFGPSVRG